MEKCYDCIKCHINLLYKLTFPSVPISNNFTPFLLENSTLPFQPSETQKPSFDFLCKWFLYNDNTANLRHHLLHILFSTFLKTFFTPFLKCSTQAGLFLKNITARKQTEKLPNNSHKQLGNQENQITRKLIKLKFTPLQIY